MPFEFIGHSISIPGQILMQIFVLATLVYMLCKHYRDILSVLLILLCWPRVFIFFGKGVENTYKIAMLLLCLYVAYRYKAWRAYVPRERWIVLAFVLFTAQFVLSAIYFSPVATNTTTILSQYARYIEAFLLYFIIKEAVYCRGRKEQLLRLFYDIGLMQIIISVFKFAVFRTQIEGLVGSFSIAGGAVGTTIPILWFIILWLYRKGQFNKWDWLYLLGLLFLGFTTGKRAVMFILPVVVFVFFVYVQGVRIKKSWIAMLAFVPLLFYLGVRLTPTLNPEHQVWGSFDWDYAIGYAEEYQFGKKGIEGQVEEYQEDRQTLQYAGGQFSYMSPKKQTAEGRGGATIALFKLLVGIYPSISQDWWGLGFNSMYSTDYAEFDELPLTIRINHKGSATGFFQSYVTTGLLGTLCTIFFCFVFWFYCRNHRLRLTIVGICAWEYFMYTGILFRTPVFMALLFLVVHYVNAEIIQRRQPFNRLTPNR